MSQTRGRPFAPGNKLGRGRPRGSRNKATLVFQKMLGHLQQTLPQARFGLLKIAQLLRELLNQLFQFGNNLLV